MLLSEEARALIINYKKYVETEALYPIVVRLLKKVEEYEQLEERIKKEGLSNSIDNELLWR